MVDYKGICEGVERRIKFLSAGCPYVRNRYIEIEPDAFIPREK